MTYDVLVAEVATRASVSPEIVRAVVFHLPDALLQLAEGDSVRTPLGVFRMLVSQARPIRLPDGSMAQVSAKHVVRLRPGVRLQDQAVPPSAKITG